MSIIVKPMLAASMENSKGEPMSFKDLKYPLGASIKLDGIRCERIDGKTLSRSFKPIPNLYIQAQMAGLPDGLDGELVTYNPDGTVKQFNEVQGDVMREDGEPNFRFEIFDYVRWSLSETYTNRIKDLKNASSVFPAFCTLVLPTIINNEAELLKYEEEALADGHEGIMIRRLDGPYKCGRSTFKSQDLIKIKRFVDSEAEIIGFEERMSNQNEATVDELGHTKRSSHMANMVPAGTLGKFLARDIHSGDMIKVGTGKGLNDLLRQEIWDNQDKYVGKLFKYRYQEVGMKDLPRIPSFQGFRDRRDM
jgi:DNA ligase 1